MSECAGAGTTGDGARSANAWTSDRLLAGTPGRSTGNLSVVHLALEATSDPGFSHRSTPAWAIIPAV